ncbi:MAG: PAS domain S-box protein [Spirochaetaceae bacterium]|nr:PAS domain S-box protein [Spirochaetaceae bacterium]
MPVQILQNIALIITIAAFYNILPQLTYEKSLRMTILNGLLFGLTAILAMSAPFTATKGIIYDGRSIVMALAGVFSDPTSAIMAGIIASLFRVFAIGGSGSIPGVLTIAGSVAIGILVRSRNKNHGLKLSFPVLLLTGFAVHIFMILAQFALPNQAWKIVIPSILPTVLTLYPLGFAVTSLFFLENKKHIAEHFQLKESEARYRSIFQNRHTVMVISEPGTGQIIDVNPAAEEFYGWPRAKMLDMQLSDIRVQEAPAIEVGEAESKTPFSPSKSRNRLSSGEVRDVEVFSGPIEYFGKRAIFSIVHDTTSRVEAERTIQQMNQTLEQKVRERTVELEETNGELKAFAYSVSHDLRAPLRAIEGFSSLLKENIGGHLEQREQHYLERITYNSKKMDCLIDDLLRFSRVSSQPIAFSLVDLSGMAGVIIEDLRLADPDRQASVSIQEGMTAYADEALIGIVLSNLLGNAWKFTAKTADATIRFQCEPVNNGEREGEKVFSISDNGIGFDMAYADKLFSPFQRLHTEAEFPGTGIGLSLVRRILSRHGGRIWVQAAPDQGAQFFFTLGGNNVDNPA